MEMYVSVVGNEYFIAIGQGISTVYNNHISLESQLFGICGQKVEWHKVRWSCGTFSSSHRLEIMLVNRRHCISDCGMHQEAIIWVRLDVLTCESDSCSQLGICCLAAYGTKVDHNDIFQIIQNSVHILLPDFTIFFPTDILICVIFCWWERLIVGKFWKHACCVLSTSYDGTRTNAKGM